MESINRAKCRKASVGCILLQATRNAVKYRLMLGTAST